jgi:hypothetical protein
MPDFHYPNLISRLVKLMLERLSADWQKHRGHPLALVETFVDPRHFTGTAYKVSGWCHLGKSAGWTRDAEDLYEKNDAPKQTWVRRLVKKACVKLRAAQLPPDWASVEEAARVRTPGAGRILGTIRRVVVSLANTAVNGARKNNPKTKHNTRSFQIRFRSARGGREQLRALIFAKSPNVLAL